jgi:hypothetical protein
MKNPRVRKGASLAERIESKTDRSGGPNACHPWIGGRGNSGTPNVALGIPGRRRATGCARRSAAATLVDKEKS